MRVFLLLSATGFIIMFFTFDTYACRCTEQNNPVCRKYWETDAIFSGQVVAVDPPGPPAVGSRVFTIKVEKAFKGINSEKVEVYTGDGRKDCGFPFEIGKRYLVYAQSDGGLSTSICTRTQELSRADDDVRYIEKLPTMTDGVTVFGSITKLGRVGDVYKPVTNLDVDITEVNSRLIKRTRTDDKGKFSIAGLPAGIYLIDPLFEPGKSFYDFDRPDGRWAYSIPNKGCAEVNFGTYFEAKISGKLVDSSGKGVGQYDIQLVSAEHQFKSETDMAVLLGWRVTDSDGTFVFEAVPPGRYLLGIGIGGAADIFGKNGRIFYPDTLDPRKAKVLVVEDRPMNISVELRTPASSR